ncbi:MAG: acyl-CoA dehydrogenase family protein [Lachnospiraceae bacterium]|nr:acyl-CoA dehydrogenase family protein [Lachnospiraceae bacterium]
MGYLISEEAQELVDAVRDFCENEVKEQSKEYDRTGEWPAEIYEKAKEMQLHMLEIPEEYGGLGLDKLTCAALYEEMARADAGFALTFAVSNIDLTPVMKFGTEEQKRRFCDIILGGQFGAFAITEPQAGSDAANGKTTARKDGDYYVLNGRKTFITNGGVAGVYLVTAMTDKSKGLKGMSAFIVEAGTPGLSTGHHEDKMGIRGSNTCDVVFDECRIPASALLGKEGEGFKIAMLTLDVSRTFVGCMAIGIAQRAMEEGKSYGMESAIAKCYGGDVAMQVTTDAVQVFGGYGYSKDYPVEKLMRDAKIYQIFEGTNQIQRVVIANHLMNKY